MCGEYTKSTIAAVAVAGSSPRVWGIHQKHNCGSGCCRFIPTCVGNTRVIVGISVGVEVHPHVCGEYNRPFLGGSRVEVHPHVCGEYHLDNADPGALTGSSPRVWGIPLYSRFHVLFLRFIPTCVGNTRRKSEERPNHQVHPHVCGEYPRHSHDPSRLTGSSPRVWGIQHLVISPDPSSRFIPTCVGNTKMEIKPNHQNRVHPHVCGEYAMSEVKEQPILGSSPRVWGIRDPHSSGKRSRRFIPTCVGNTLHLGSFESRH